MSELPLHMYRACRPDFNGPRSDDRPFGLGTGGIRETTKECEHVGEREKDGGQEGGEKGDRESEREREREREKLKEAGRRRDVQGYLTYKKTHLSRTLQ